MDALKVRVLVSALCNDSGCAIARRGYGAPWGADLKRIKSLEALGYLKFTSYHRDPFTRDSIRRSKITETGRAELRRKCHEGPCDHSSAMTDDQGKPICAGCALPWSECGPADRGRDCPICSGDCAGANPPVLNCPSARR
jgi:hypothetical protein